MNLLRRRLDHLEGGDSTPEIIVVHDRAQAEVVKAERAAAGATQAVMIVATGVLRADDAPQRAYHRVLLRP